MTREEVKKAAEIMLAFADGAEIQYSHKGQNNWLNWINESSPSFDWQAFDYRIKPKLKYRPFKTQEECWSEMHKHPDFGWVMAKDKKELVQIGRVLTSMLNNVMITLSIDEGHNFNSSHYFKKYTFTDGAPFGIKE